MAARKKTRHGATQPEDARAAKAVLLRLRPDVIAMLDELRGGRQRSAYVTRLVRMAAGIDPDAEPKSLAHAKKIEAATRKAVPAKAWSGRDRSDPQ